METLWFALVAGMLAVYVVLDGFDLGAGVAHFVVGRTERERGLVLRSIGPVWDGNEVWLLAAGGTLYFAFPAVYAAGFSGFYLPLMIVLWLLMIRGMGVELRGHVDDPMWRAFWDAAFAAASALLAVFLGAALGNVIRGVPLGPDGYFFLPLWTTFAPGPRPGVLDWYTVLTGVTALVVLGAHGSAYVAMKTEGEVRARARRLALASTAGVALLTLVCGIATISVQPAIAEGYRARPWMLVVPALALAGLAATFVFRLRGDDVRAFLASSVYIVGTLGGAAAGLYPTLLHSTLDPSAGLTVGNSAARSYGLGVGLVWWTIGLALAVGYAIYMYRSFSGTVTADEPGAAHGD